MRLARDALVRQLFAAALSGTAVLHREQRASAAVAPAAAVTQRVFLDLRIIKEFNVEVLEDAAVRGRLEIGLYGRDAPLATAKFLDFIQGTTGQYAKTGGGPAYSQAQFERIRPGELLEGGRIAGLRQTDFAGGVEWEYLSRLLPTLRPVLEVNELRHDARGLLTIERFGDGGPNFGVTLGAAPQLDGTREVIGRVESDPQGLLAQIEQLPYITGKSLEGEGTAANSVFQAQKSFFTTLSKAAGDSRSEDRTGKLLRRVEITQCGLL